jgi:hypothetical protein
LSADCDITELLKGLGEARERAQAAALRALDIAGEQVIGDAQQLCPVLTGALQASGTAEEPAQVVGDGVQKIIGFKTAYAAAVHENLTAHHTVGQAKFLETAVRNDAGKVKEYLADEVRKALEG